MSFYSSGQQRLAINTRERRMEQANGDKQQARVYTKIATDQGDIEMADRYAKIGMSIVGNIARTEVPITNKQGGVVRQTVLEHVKSMIDTGTLSQWWDAIKRIPPKKLSPKARVVQDDIKHNSELKAVMNDMLTKAYMSKQEGIIIDGLVQEALDVLTGGDKEVEQELDGTASEFLGSAHGSAESQDPTTQGTVGKALKAEQDLSGMKLPPGKTIVEIQDLIKEYTISKPSKDKWNALAGLSKFKEAMTPDLLKKILSDDDIRQELMHKKSGVEGKTLGVLRKLEVAFSKKASSSPKATAARLAAEQALGRA